METNELLARWQGFSDNFYGAPLPDYLNDDAACDSLLDTLVEKGYDPELYHGWDDGVGVWCFQAHVGNDYHIKPTRREAIIAACLEVARKELNHVD